MTLLDKIFGNIFSIFLRSHQRLVIEASYRRFDIDRSFSIDHRLWIEGNVSIRGPGYINGPSKLVAGKEGKITIGAHCEIAENVHMRAETHDTDYATGPSKKMNPGEIHIGNNVWIGTNVFIGPNIRVGDGAVIGANSVITKDVPQGTVVGGVPAKIIRKTATGT